MQEQQAIQPTDPMRPTQRASWLTLAVLFFAVAAMHAKAVPYNNELIYLVRLAPNALGSDWSFAQAANEHWLFNTIFASLARVISVETLAWIGRIGGWLLCLTALIRLGRRWEIGHWAIVVSIGFWLAFRQSVVNAEWIFGTFEAKVLAYACLLFALDRFIDGKNIVASILLGFTFSFHPAVGLWAIPAVGIALLWARFSIVEYAKVVGLTFVAALPGILPLLVEQTNLDAASFDDWQFIVTKHMPFHFDPFYFGGAGIAIIFAMLAFNVVVVWRRTEFAFRFLLTFQLSLASFFLLGVAMRWLELFSLLRFMPMRLFPVITPLFFLFTALYAFRRAKDLHAKVAVVLYAAILIAFLHPFENGVYAIRGTVDTWRVKPDDVQITLDWVAHNTPADATILVTPTVRDFWYRSKRAEVVSYFYPRYDRLTEWRKRVADMSGGAEIVDRQSSLEAIDTGFDSLTITQIGDLKRTYSAGYLISRTIYPLPVVFESGDQKIYELR